MDPTNVSTVVNNPVIADIIGGFLSVTDLKTCRQVSKEWYSWSGPSLRKNVIFTVSNLNDFQKLVRHPDEKYNYRPHKQVVFNINILDGTRLAKSLNVFWSTHGLSLTYLKLENVQKFGGDFIQDVLYRQTPNLKTLVIRKCFDSTGEQLLEQVELTSGREQTKLTHLEIGLSLRFADNNNKINILHGLLKLYPKLKILRISRFFWERCYDSLSVVLDPLAEIRKKDPEKYNLQELDIINIGRFERCVTIPFWKTLGNLQLTLKTLTLDLEITTEDIVVVGILAFYRETLETLELFRPGAAIPYQLFPFGIPLESLKVLRISNQVFQTMEFVKWMPKLELLHICSRRMKNPVLWNEAEISKSRSYRAWRNSPMVIERTDINSIENFELECLKEFSFTYPFYTKEMKQKLAKWMPRAKINWMVTFTN